MNDGLSSCNCGCGNTRNSGLFGNLFGTGDNTEVLLFLVVFLLLFTNLGCNSR